MKTLKHVNEDTPIGTAVIVVQEGPTVLRTMTISPAGPLHNKTAVLVEGLAGPINVNRVFELSE